MPLLDNMHRHRLRYPFNTHKVSRWTSSSLNGQIKNLYYSTVYIHNVVHHRVAHTIESRTFAWHSSFHLKYLFTRQLNMSSFSQERRIILAIQAIQNNQNLSRRQAAKIYEVPETTLRDRMSGRTSKNDSRNGRQKLTKSEEDAIVEYILDLDERAFPPRIAGVEDMANLLLESRDGGCVGPNWTTRFIARREELKTRLNRVYDFQRAACEHAELIGAWFKLVDNMKAKYGIADSDFYNFDETGFMMGLICASMVVTRANRQGKSKSVQPGNREWATAIECVNSEGWCLPPFLVVQGANHLAHWYSQTNLPGDWVIKTTSNGWTDNETGVEWIRHFDQHTKSRVKGTYRMLVLDGHGSHKSPAFDMFCKDNKIISLCLPAHSSHLLQPLDVGCFNPLKRAYGKALEDFIKSHVNHITKTEFFIAFYAAHVAAMTSQNIQGGFKGTGLVPFDPECVISKLDVKLGTRTPPEATLPPTQPWTSQTPHNPTESISQSELVKARMSNHQNSSPTQILTAAKQLADGVAELAHGAVLITDELRSLRKANEALSKGRRAKKTRLRQREAVTVRDAQDELEQRGVSGRLEREEGENGSGDRGQRRGQRRCGNCGKTGHNARTCEEDRKEDSP